VVVVVVVVVVVTGRDVEQTMQNQGMSHHSTEQKRTIPRLFSNCVI
jgi:hypothetical protein